jgi:L-2-amino-thiazoline-4-carboxylic acid hydrolase
MVAGVRYARRHEPRGEAMNEVEALRVQLKNAMQARAMVYAAVYDELEAELGAGRAEAIMKRAIHKRGLAIGAQFARFGPRDIEGLRAAFLAFVPDGGRPFAPEVKRCDAGGLDIKFHACPLKEAWLEAGMGAGKVAKLCSIAGVVDNGTFEAAGFEFHAETWRPGDEGCCFLHVRPGRG